jgi:signal transduction histidine kinase
VKPSGKSDDAVLAAIEREQQRIGNQLHEKVCQTLAGISIQVGLLTHRSQRGEIVEHNEIEQLGRHLQQAIDQVRAFSRELCGGNLHAGELIEALAHLADHAAREVPCEFVCEKPIFVRDRRVSLALLRIAQESVRNAIQHAAPKKIVIFLRRTDHTVTLAIRDDGKGFTPPAGEESVNGIGIMRRRARVAGVVLNIASSSGGGTIVSCTIPSVE